MAEIPERWFKGTEVPHGGGCRSKSGYDCTCSATRKAWRAAEARIRELEQADRIKTGELNVLVQENRSLQAQLQAVTQAENEANGRHYDALMEIASIKSERDYFEEELAAVTQERDTELASKNTAYSERDALVCALSKLFPAHIERHPDSDLTWEDDWRWIVFIQFPTGQGSWHIHDSELGWFDHLTRTGGNTWDGHTTAEKYARIARLEIIHHLPNLAQLQAHNKAMRDALRIIRKDCFDGSDWAKVIDAALTLTPGEASRVSNLSQPVPDVPLCPRKGPK